MTGEDTVLTWCAVLLFVTGALIVALRIRDWWNRVPYDELTGVKRP